MEANLKGRKCHYIFFLIWERWKGCKCHFNLMIPSIICSPRKIKCGVTNNEKKGTILHISMWDEGNDIKIHQMFPSKFATTLSIQNLTGFDIIALVSPTFMQYDPFVFVLHDPTYYLPRTCIILIVLLTWNDTYTLSFSLKSKKVIMAFSSF